MPGRKKRTTIGEQTEMRFMMHLTWRDAPEWFLHNAASGYVATKRPLRLIEPGAGSDGNDANASPHSLWSIGQEHTGLQRQLPGSRASGYTEVRLAKRN